MPNELTPAEAAEYIEDGLKDAGDMLDREAIEAYSLAASLCRKVAEGEYKPVVHARWESNKAGYRVCSACDGQPGFEDWVNGQWKLPDWCFYCGARMDGKDGSDGKAD